MEPDKIPVSIKITISESDWEELREGKVFDWSYTSEDGKYEVAVEVKEETGEDME